jgi:hypothetical protein
LEFICKITQIEEWDQHFFLSLKFHTVAKFEKNCGKLNDFYKKNRIKKKCRKIARFSYIVQVGGQKNKDVYNFFCFIFLIAKSG